MSKPYTKKMLTVMITVAMVFSALAILSFAMTPAYAASSGTVTLNPTTFSAGSGTGVATTVLANGGTFTQGATLTFYISPVNSFSSGNSTIGTYTLGGAATSLSNVAVTLFTLTAGGGTGHVTTLTAGDTYYVGVSDGSGFADAGAISIVSGTPTLSLSSASAKAGATDTLSTTSNHPFDTGSTVEVYLNYVSGTVLISSVSAGSLSSGYSFTVPTNEPQGTYTVIAQETSPSTANNYGITAQISLTINPSVTASPISISGATSSSFALAGHGFPSSVSFSASTSLNTANAIILGSSNDRAINPAFSSDSTGSFTVTTTGIASALSTAESANISMHSSTGTPFSNVGSIIVSIPNPTALGFDFAISPTSPLSSPNVYVNDSVTITVWNFPASQSTQFNLGSTSVGSLTTDANGAGTLSTVIPAIPAGSYKPTAVVASDYLSIEPSVTLKSVTVENSFSVVDSAGTTLVATNEEYMPSSGMITVQAFGLTPTTDTYDFADSVAASSGVYAGSLVTSIAVGTETSSGLQPAANGTLIFTYSPAYASLATPPATGADVTVTSLNSVVNEYGYSNTGNFGYDAIGAVTWTPSSATIEKAGSTVSFTPSGLIPYDATVAPNVIVTYNLYAGSTELQLSYRNHASTTVTGQTSFDSGDTSITFAAPSTNGLYNLTVTYNGQSTSTSPGTQYLVVSTSGSSPSDGSLTLIATTNGYKVVGIGFDGSSTSWKLYYASYGNAISTGASESLTNGAFVDTTTLANVQYSEPAGTYYLFLVTVDSSTNYYVNSSYTVSSNLSLSANYGNIGSSITVTAYGLVPTTSYNVYFGTNLELSNTGTNLQAGSQSFTVPNVPKGIYTVSVEPVGSSTATETAGYQVKANSAITLGTSSQYAFPGQLVTFSVTGLSLASPLNIPLAGPTEYFAQVSFNGSLVATVPATFQTGSGGTTYLNGSFENPNNAAGSYYKITFGGYLQASALSSSGGSITGGQIAQVALTGTASDFFGLVSGNGALLTGITSSEIATLEADINSTVSTSLTVPISQLNAAITSINGAVATLKTTVGNITADLSTINATVSSIESGQVTVLTDLGSISTSLASLNASLVAFNNNVVTINTTLGQVVTSLGSINTTVAANSNGIATIKTDLGTLQGQIVSTNGNVSSIKTSLGTLTTNVSNVSKQTQGFPTLEIFLIVIIVLVLITLVISFLAVSAANKAARRVTEEKKL